MPPIIYLFLVAALTMLVRGEGAPATTPSSRPGWSAPETENIKSNGGVGAQLWLVDPEFVKEWQKPEDPKITPIAKPKRRQEFVAALIVAGAGRDAAGKSDVRYDLVIDGSTLAEQKGLVALSGSAPPEHVLMLGEHLLHISIDPPDPAGTYIVEATVRDHVRDVDISLRTKFTIED